MKRQESNTQGVFPFTSKLFGATWQRLRGPTEDCVPPSDFGLDFFQLKLAKQSGGKKPNKLIFGGLEQVTSLSHAEGQRGWTEVYASTGIKVKIYFSDTWAKNYDSYFKKKEKRKNRTASYCFTTPFPQCLTSSTSILFYFFGPPTHYMQFEPFHFQNQFKAKTLDLVLPPRKQKQSAARAGERFPPPASPTADTPHYPTPPPLIPSE